MTIHSTALNDLRQVLGDRLSRSKPDLTAHGQSESYFSPVMPDAVAFPETTEEVAALAQICAGHRMPIVAWGTGTSLEGGNLAFSGGLCVDFSRMDRLLSVSPEDQTAVVQPGITRQALNEALRATGLFFPVDPGANASIGGMASTRASGTTTVRYGSMRENVLGLELVLADGRVIRTGGAVRKSASGYDLTRLFVGSEGTLGLITELTLRLWGQPEAVSAATAAFPSVDAAVESAILALQSGLSLARIELMDALSIQAINRRDRLGLPEAPHLFLEFHGSEASVAEEAERFGEIASDHGAETFDWATRAEERRRLWQTRHDAAYAIRGLRPGARMMVTDVCVPLSRLAQAVEETAADIAEARLVGPILGHVGDGNFHAVLVLDPEDAEENARARAVAERAAERALALGGTITGEHGIGVGKRGLMAAEHGAAWAVMGDLKRALDPQNLLNPGKVVPPQA